MTEFTVTSKNLTLPYGTRFKCRPRFPIQTDALYLLTINQLLTIGRYYRDIDGREWIVQPGLLIQVSDEFDVEIWGEVVPLTVPSGIDLTASPSLLFAGAAIIKICDMLAPLAV
jgi:hypothetical protein